MVSSVVKIITPPRAHAACKKWIIFSDLHVKSSSIETCEIVLKQVHEESLKRNVSEQSIWILRYLCMYVCMYVCMHVCMFVFMYKCMYLCMCCMYVCIIIYMHVRRYVFSMYKCM